MSMKTWDNAQKEGTDVQVHVNDSKAELATQGGYRRLKA